MPVRHAILALLNEKPRHGYGLRDAFESLVGGPAVWELKLPQVYTTLNRLERDGLIEPCEQTQAGGPERVSYRLTEAGSEELLAWFAAGVHGEHVRDGFFVKLMASLATPETDPREVLRIQRATLYRDLHALTARRSALDRGTQLSRVMLLDKAVMHLEADLRWLDMVEARLSEIESQPVETPKPRKRGRPPRIQDAEDPEGPLQEQAAG